MSQRAPRRMPRTATMASAAVVDGSTARELRPEPVAASDLQFADTKRRISLSLVPNSTPKRRRSMVVMISVLVLAAFALVLTLVMLNTSVAQRQYEMVSLRNQERALSQENQSLLKEAQSLSAPQSLAKRAKELGLVAPAAPGLIDLEGNQISKKAESATQPTEENANNTSLPLPGESIRSKDSTSSNSGSAVANSEQGMAQEPEAIEVKAEEVKEPEAQVEPKAPVKREQADNGRPTFEPRELNGGTIPAPEIKSPTN